MTRTDGWTRRRFLKRSAAAATGFTVTARALIGAKPASGSFFMREFVNCSPVAFFCYGGILWLLVYCHDAFSGWYCCSEWWEVACCNGRIATLSSRR